MTEVPPISAIIEHYGGKIRRDYGSWQKIKCPFHDDSHASAGVSVMDNIFVCHGCGVKGNAFNVIKIHEGVKYGEAIKIAEGITGESYQSLRGVPSLGRRILNPKGNKSRDSSRDSIRSRR
jgi:DNA primase